eukprot:snap_masked-scaffold_54-processed-gene-1.61-mRNA-1 protein AED:1.00 eAED:1.00 QI:0/0/0/0/1/1/3/0/218
MNFSIECIEDEECPTTLKCFESGWFAENALGNTCSCHSFGWTGEECIKLGPGSISVLLICGSTIFLCLFYLGFVTKRICSLIITSQSINENKTTSLRLIRKMFSKPSFQIYKKNLFLLKTQTLYLCFFLCSFLCVTNLLYLIILFKPRDFIVQDGIKKPKLKQVKDYFIIGWIFMYLVTSLQLAVSWLYLGHSNTHLNNRLSSSFLLRIRTVRKRNII